MGTNAATTNLGLRKHAAAFAESAECPAIDKVCTVLF